MGRRDKRRNPGRGTKNQIEEMKAQQRGTVFPRPRTVGQGQGGETAGGEVHFDGSTCFLPHP